MAIDIISKEDAAHGKKIVRFLMNDGEGLFLKCPAGLTNAQLKDLARDEYAKIKEAQRLQERSARIAVRVAQKVVVQGVDVQAAAEIDQES